MNEGEGLISFSKFTLGDCKLDVCSCKHLPDKRCRVQHDSIAFLKSRVFMPASLLLFRTRLAGPKHCSRALTGPKGQADTCQQRRIFSTWSQPPEVEIVLLSPTLNSGQTETTVAATSRSQFFSLISQILLWKTDVLQDESCWEGARSCSLTPFRNLLRCAGIEAARNEKINPLPVSFCMLKSWDYFTALFNSALPLTPEKKEKPLKAA